MEEHTLSPARWPSCLQALQMCRREHLAFLQMPTFQLLQIGGVDEDEVDAMAVSFLEGSAVAARDCCGLRTW